jgi:GNAT superfamily N-acetyltransferase
MAKGLLALSGIYVQPAYRSKGVGWQLIEPLVMVARVKRGSVLNCGVLSGQWR